MSKKTSIIIGSVLLMLSLLFVSCENQNPLQNETAVESQMVGVSFDQLNIVEWSPEVSQQIRMSSELDESEGLNKRGGGSDRLGIDIQEIDYEDGGVVGGAVTFGNSVYVPPGALLADKFIAVQVACMDADVLAIVDGADTELALLDADLNTLYAALMDDYSDYDEDDDFSEAIEKLEKGMEKMDEVAVNFILYSYYVSEKAFTKLEKDIIQSMDLFAVCIDQEFLSESYVSTLRLISERATAMARDMAMTSITYAESLDDANQGKINQAYGHLDDGDEALLDPDDDYNFEWYEYKNATNNYRNSWKKATQALHQSDSPCGALVDFLPSQQFEADVYVTLSWEALDFEGNPDDLDIYWYNEETNLWVLVPNPVINWDDGTVSVYIDHFTRYAWVVRPPPAGD